MFSVLIPIYNYNILPLLESLYKELITIDTTFEVLCIDDASEISYIENKDIASFKNCSYEILSVNIGRSKIRNLLVEKAKYNNLIFLDADIIPERKDFLQEYLENLKKNDIIFGGISYPKNTLFSLHYKYGKAREEKSVTERLKSKKLHFTTANFAIKKSVFNEVRFDESINTYGYEDIVFSNNLILKGYQIKQINNSVIHLGIVKNNRAYITKEHESLSTLYKLYNSRKINKKEVRLLAYYASLKRIKLLSIYKSIYNFYKKKMLKNLMSNHPSLLVFDLYRLGYFSNLKS